jgi:hypothetical protein
MRIRTEFRSLAAAALIGAVLLGPASALAQVCEEAMPPPPPPTPTTAVPAPEIPPVV